MSIITCPNCGTKNRVDESRADHDLAKCGKCGKPLPAAGSVPVIITDDNFSTEVMSAGAVPVLVDCWAVWCPPCRAIAPIVDALAAESAGRWKIGKLNVDENPRTAGQFHTDSIPTLLIFKNGKLVDRVVGLNPKPVIEALLLQWARPKQ
jgi:thioredoxin 2